MRSITEAHGGVYNVISEPGDMTRYDYFVYRSGPDEFHFMPRKNTFKYPQRIDYWFVKPFIDGNDTEPIMIIAKDYGCNPHTVMECVNLIKEIKGE